MPTIIWATLSKPTMTVVPHDPALRFASSAVFLALDEHKLADKTLDIYQLQRRRGGRDGRNMALPSRRVLKRRLP